MTTSVMILLALLGAALLAAAVYGVLAFSGSRRRLGAAAPRSRRRRRAERVLVEDALKHLHQREAEEHPATVESLAGILGIPPGTASLLVDRLMANGYVQERDRGYGLTEEGRGYARHVIRVHRLWERYLSDETAVADADLHTLAERAEHRITPEEADALYEKLGRPARDPHGDPIPSADGHLPHPEGTPLTAWPTDRTARIVHLEDEPPEVYRRLLDQGLRLEMLLEVTARSAEGVAVRFGGSEILLSPAAAANVTVLAAEAVGEGGADGVPLSELRPGDEGIVVALDDGCRGMTRRRFMDLGLTPGGAVRVEMSSPFGDPRAYRIRGTVIALRHEQARQIRVRREDR